VPAILAGAFFSCEEVMYTISVLAKEFGLSRSALIYYDKKNILTPSLRSPQNDYRLYTAADREKLRQICTLRSVGISLAKIKAIISQKESDSSEILKQRLFALDSEIIELRQQQQIIAKLLGCKKLLKQTRTMDKPGWIALLKAAGLDSEGMNKWHQAFEQSAPKAHQDFLESLGITAAEIRKIRQRSANA
jgi:MerR family transcriptional regulator, thiopeptide resistance regulator